MNLEKFKKIEKIENFGDGPGCFGGYWGVIPEYFYGIFEGFWKVKNSKITGIIATNTTTDKSTLKDKKYWNYEGGLSGEPLRKKSNDLICEIRSISKEIPLIGVGGVMSQKDYKEKLDLGANLVQIYTGFIMEGPSLIYKIINK